MVDFIITLLINVKRDKCRFGISNSGFTTCVALRQIIVNQF